MATSSERRFFTTKPRQIYFETVEIYHPQIGTLRFVARQYFDKIMTLESTAPRNPNQAVTFKPASMEISPLDQSDNPVAGMAVQLGRVGQQVKDQLKKISGTGWFDQMEFIYRAYDGSDLSAPINVPPVLFVSGINMDSDSVSITAEDDNPMGVSVARKYLAQDFPGLEVQF